MCEWSVAQPQLGACILTFIRVREFFYLQLVKSMQVRYSLQQLIMFWRCKLYARDEYKRSIR